MGEINWGAANFLVGVVEHNFRRAGSRKRQQRSKRERLRHDRDEWVSFHAGPPAPHPTAPHDLPGYNVVTHDLWLPNGGLASSDELHPDYGRLYSSMLYQLFGGNYHIYLLVYFRLGLARLYGEKLAA